MQIGFSAKYFGPSGADRLHGTIFVCLILCITPLAGHLLWGSAFFSDSLVFTCGTIVNLVPCIAAYRLNLLVARHIASRYSDTHQTAQRVAFWFTSYCFINLLLLGLALYLYDRFHIFGFNFRSSFIFWPATILFSGSLVAAGVTELLYTFGQWKTNQDELQGLERRQLQTELDVIKQQVNPHFLFNCLNSLSVLIAEAPATAEKFVDEMSQVYRYLLSANAPGREDALVSLESEVRFIKSYIYLLKTRFEAGIHIKIDTQEVYLGGQLAPLTLQTLIDNAIRHNVVSESTPLYIVVRTTPTGQLEVCNNLQKRLVRMPFGNAGLASLVSRYKLLFNQAGTIQINQEDSHFTVILPLIYT